MLFPTFDFLLFAFPALLGFWLLAKRPVARVLFLTAVSFFFYMAGPKTEPPPAPWYFVGLLVFSTVLDFVCGREIYKLADAAQAEDTAICKPAQRKRAQWMAASLVGNLGLLGYFKYANFFFEAFADIARAANVDVAVLHLDVVLPLGISFYTFQSLSYTLDIYRGRLEPETKLSRFALFVAFFPQLVAGPIVRASELLPQLRLGPRFSRAGFEGGAFRICRGLVKKVVLGDFIAVHLTDRIFDAPTTFTTVELLIALYAYTLQIYADFSGYSDIAIGLGRMLGFELPENFDRPYQSKDIAEYWRRWHMTLSSWLRDYLFFNLLARFGARAGYIALWLSMFLVGMWHGASWNFVIYANIHAFAVVFNRWSKQRRPKTSVGVRVAKWTLGTVVGFGLASALCHEVLALPWRQAFGLGGFMAAAFVGISWLPAHQGHHGKGKKKNKSPIKSKFIVAVHIAITFHLLVLSRIFFRASDLETARRFVAGLLNFSSFGVRPGLASGWIWGVLVFGLVFHFTPKDWVDVRALRLFRRLPGIVVGPLVLAMCYGLMKVLEGAPRAFIYFQF